MPATTGTPTATNTTCATATDLRPILLLACRLLLRFFTCSQDPKEFKESLAVLQKVGVSAAHIAALWEVHPYALLLDAVGPADARQRHLTGAPRLTHTRPSLTQPRPPQTQSRPCTTQTLSGLLMLGNITYGENANGDAAITNNKVRGSCAISPSLSVSLSLSLSLSRSRSRSRSRSLSLSRSLALSLSLSLSRSHPKT